MILVAEPLPRFCKYIVLSPGIRIPDSTFQLHIPVLTFSVSRHFQSLPQGCDGRKAGLCLPPLPNIRLAFGSTETPAFSSCFPQSAPSTPPMVSQTPLILRLTAMCPAMVFYDIPSKLTFPMRAAQNMYFSFYAVTMCIYVCVSGDL